MYQRGKNEKCFPLALRSKTLLGPLGKYFFFFLFNFHSRHYISNIYSLDSPSRSVCRTRIRTSPSQLVPFHKSGLQASGLSALIPIPQIESNGDASANILSSVESK